jgi:UDP-glucose 4-epimerase
MARVLVPGGAGYIGSHVVRQLIGAGHEVVVLDNLSTGFRDAVDPAAQLVVMDLADVPAVRELVASGRFDTVMHFAANIVVPESVADPLKYYLNNTVNTTHLIQACVDGGVHQFIFSSTAAVYGMPDTGAASETTPTEPINPYGRSKLMSEWVLQDVSAATPLRYVALRYFNVAGAALDGTIGQRTKGATHLIKVASQAALGRRRRLSIFGTDYDTPDGTCVRDYIHVEDLARAHLDALTWLGAGGDSQILNCGYGHGASVRQVLDTMRRVSAVDFEVVEVGRRAGDPPALIARADRIREVLGWVPRHDDLDLICKSAWAWEASLSVDDM